MRVDLKTAFRNSKQRSCADWHRTGALVATIQHSDTIHRKTGWMKSPISDPLSAALPTGSPKAQSSSMGKSINTPEINRRAMIPMAASAVPTFVLCRQFSRRRDHGQEWYRLSKADVSLPRNPELPRRTEPFTTPPLHPAPRRILPPHHDPPLFHHLTQNRKQPKSI